MVDVHTEVNTQLKTALHPPKAEDFTKTLAHIPFEELNEMAKNESYLE
jgi:hypothetical protein